MDWQAWARRFESVHGPEEFAGLFAVGGTFCDPVTPPTTDVRKVASDTDGIFPDWSQTVDLIRGGRDWAVFEWTGTGTFNAGEGRSARIVMTGRNRDRRGRRGQSHPLARLPRYERAHPADPQSPRGRRVAVAATATARRHVCRGVRASVIPPISHTPISVTLQSRDLELRSTGGGSPKRRDLDLPRGGARRDLRRDLRRGVRQYLGGGSVEGHRAGR